MALRCEFLLFCLKAQRSRCRPPSGLMHLSTLYFGSGLLAWGQLDVEFPSPNALRPATNAHHCQSVTPCVSHWAHHWNLPGQHLQPSPGRALISRRPFGISRAPRVSSGTTPVPGWTGAPGRTGHLPPYPAREASRHHLTLGRFTCRPLFSPLDWGVVQRT